MKGSPYKNHLAHIDPACVSARRTSAQSCGRCRRTRRCFSSDSERSWGGVAGAEARPWTRQSSSCPLLLQHGRRLLAAHASVVRIPTASRDSTGRSQRPRAHAAHKKVREQISSKKKSVLRHAGVPYKHQGPHRPRAIHINLFGGLGENAVVVPPPLQMSSRG